MCHAIKVTTSEVIGKGHKCVFVFWFLLTKRTLFNIFLSGTIKILIHLPHRTKFDPKSSVFKVSHSRRGGTLSHSNGKVVYEHGPTGNGPEQGQQNF